GLIHNGDVLALRKRCQGDYRICCASRVTKLVGRVQPTSYPNPWWRSGWNCNRSTINLDDEPCAQVVPKPIIIDSQLELGRSRRRHKISRSSADGYRFDHRSVAICVCDAESTE